MNEGNWGSRSAGLDSLFKEIAKQNDNRLVMAHGAFDPAADESVQFARTTATGGRVRKVDPIWTKKMFEEAYKTLRDITKRVSEVRPTLTISISPEGKSELLTAYHYGTLGGYY